MRFRGTRRYRFHAGVIDRLGAEESNVADCRREYAALLIAFSATGTVGD